MAVPKAQLYELDRAERAAFNSLMNSNQDDPKVAQRKLRKAQAEHITHTGGATPQELRDVYDYCYPHGPTCRAHAPERWAILWALFESYEGDLRTACANGNTAIGPAELARLNAIGADRGYRDMLVQMFEQDSWEVMDNIVAGRIFDRDRFAKMVLASLPRMAASAQSPRDLAYLARVMNTFPEWVWESWLPKTSPVAATLLSPDSVADSLPGGADALVRADSAPLLTDAPRMLSEAPCCDATCGDGNEISSANGVCGGGNEACSYGNEVCGHGNLPPFRLTSPARAGEPLPTLLEIPLPQQPLPIPAPSSAANAASPRRRHLPRRR